MTTLILASGLAMALVIAVLATRAQWRLPVLAFALLALPGNVDNLMPQMSLDPHELANATAPAISVLNLLVGWSVALTLHEHRSVTGGRVVLSGAILLAMLAGAPAASALGSGVDVWTVMRGTLVFVVIAAFVYLGVALRNELGDGTPLAAGIAAGGIVLLGNGIYTTVSSHLDRFAATTFGRNGFAVALVLVAIVATGLAFRLWGSGTNPRNRRAALPALIAGCCLFGAAATGTRISLVLVVFAAIGAAVLQPAASRRSSVLRLGAAVLIGCFVVAAAVLLSSAGSRTVSIITDPETTVEIVTNPGGQPSYTAVRSRLEFWQLAVRMASQDPLTGVGPFQWNVERYVLDPHGPTVVADTHDAYLQLAAEYGVPVLVAYLLLLGGTLGYIGRQQLSRRHSAHGWPALAILLAAGVYPLADVTNSNLFNVRNGPLGWLLIGASIGLVIAHEHRTSAYATNEQPAR